MTVLDELFASLARATGARLSRLFFVGYLLTVTLFSTGIWLIGSHLYRSTVAVAALGIALTLRHRIAETGVNTFEGYFHPRVLVFAIGLVAVGLFLRGWRAIACGLVAATFLIHPTTACWFALWMATAYVFTSPYARPLAIGGLVAAIAIGLWAMTLGPLAGGLTLMDSSWMAAVADKDYLYPTEWPFGIWLVNLIAPAVLVWLFLVRRAKGLVSEQERAIYIGCLALLAVFIASLPFIGLRMALAIQMQTSRVLWPIEFLATVYLVWALVDAPWKGWSLTPARRGQLLIAVLVIAAATRGLYIVRLEHDRKLVEIDLPATDFQQIANWAARNTPPDAHFLVDPGHAWKYGASFRVAAERDVLLETVKDTAMALYSRDVALRVNERVEATRDFELLTVDQVRALARSYEIDYFVADHDYDLPRVYANGRFRVYALQKHSIE